MGLVRFRAKQYTFWESFGAAGFWLMPIASMTAALLISLIYIPRLSAVAVHWPALVMMYWAMYRPAWQPTGLVFIFALMCDLLSGTNLIGITALIAVLMTTVLRSQNQLFLALPFWVDWAIVAICIFIWRGLEALAQGTLLGTWPSAAMWLGSGLLSALAFPLVAFLLSPLRRAAFRF